jgi:DNA-binding GntR family transcriptional regulator
MSNTLGLAQIQNKSLREHVLSTLRAAIVNGDLKPGQTLIEADLAGELGVSRAPLREAINILGSEGLVEIMPYRGTTVKKLTRKDIEELYAVRSMMEVFAIRHIILSESPVEVINAMREICVAMQGAADQGDLRAMNQLDRHFHDTLVASSGNDLLLMLWGTVSMRVRQVMSLRNRKKGDLHVITRNHHTIVDLIACKDVEGAVQEITQHIGISGDVIAEAWEAESATTEEKAP